MLRPVIDLALHPCSMDVLRKLENIRQTASRPERGVNSGPAASSPTVPSNNFERAAAAAPAEPIAG